MFFLYSLPCSVRLWKPAIELLQEIWNLGIRPNTLTYNHAMSACVKAGQWPVAMSLLQEMEDNGISADLVTYNTVGNQYHDLVLSIVGRFLSNSSICDLYMYRRIGSNEIAFRNNSSSHPLKKKCLR